MASSSRTSAAGSISKIRNPLRKSQNETFDLCISLFHQPHRREAIESKIPQRSPLLDRGTDGALPLFISHNWNRDDLGSTTVPRLVRAGEDGNPARDDA